MGELQIAVDTLHRLSQLMNNVGYSALAEEIRKVRDTAIDMRDIEREEKGR